MPASVWCNVSASSAGMVIVIRSLYVWYAQYKSSYLDKTAYLLGVAFFAPSFTFERLVV